MNLEAQSNAPFLDENVITNMKELGFGDGEFAHRLLIVQLMSVYLSCLPERVRELAYAMQTKNASVVERIAHTLKSSSRLVGLASLGDDCQILEDFGHRNNIDGIDELYARIEQACQKAATVLREKIIELEGKK